MALLDADFWSFASQVVTVVGLPLAIFVFVYEQRKERRNEEDAVFEQLSDNYQEFLRVVLEHPDLRLFSPDATPDLDESQRERMMIVFSMLISLFERAWLLLWAPRMSAERARRWSSWEDYMREWVAREDFRAALPTLLRGEDPEFVAYLRRLADETR